MGWGGQCLPYRLNDWYMMMWMLNGGTSKSVHCTQVGGNASCPASGQVGYLQLLRGDLYAGARRRCAQGTGLWGRNVLRQRLDHRRRVGRVDLQLRLGLLLERVVILQRDQGGAAPEGLLCLLDGGILRGNRGEIPIRNQFTQHMWRMHPTHTHTHPLAYVCVRVSWVFRSSRRSSIALPQTDCPGWAPLFRVFWN